MAPDPDTLISVAGHLRAQIMSTRSTRMTGPVSELLKEFDLPVLDEVTAAALNQAFDAVGLECQPRLTAELAANTRLALTPGDPGKALRDRPEAHTTGAGAAVLVATTFEIPGYETVAFHGEVFGLVVRSRNIVSNIGASAKALVGGELKGMTTVLVDGRNQALARMRAQALSQGANAVVGLRYDSSEIGDTANEVVAYGTAVTVRALTDATAETSAGGA